MLDGPSSSPSPPPGVLHLLMNWPVGLNFWMRCSLSELMYTHPSRSTAMDVGQMNCPSPAPYDPKSVRYSPSTVQMVTCVLRCVGVPRFRTYSTPSGPRAQSTGRLNPRPVWARSPMVCE